MNSKAAAFVFTVEVELQAVCIDVVQWNAQLSSHMLHDAAEASWDEEHLDVALVQTVHELPGERVGRQWLRLKIRWGAWRSTGSRWGRWMWAQVSKETKQERLKVKQGRREKDNKQEGTHFCWTLKLFPDGLFTIAKKQMTFSAPQKC